MAPFPTWPEVEGSNFERKVSCPVNTPNSQERRATQGTLLSYWQTREPGQQSLGQTQFRPSKGLGMRVPAAAGVLREKAS